MDTAKLIPWNKKYSQLFRSIATSQYENVWVTKVDFFDLYYDHFKEPLDIEDAIVYCILKTPTLYGIETKGDLIKIKRL